MQRAIEFYQDQTDFDDNVDRVVDDYLITGLGVPRIKLDAEIIESQVTGPMGPVVGDDGKPLMQETIGRQIVRIEHCPSAYFGWEPCVNWDHCEWVYFEHHLTPAEVKRRWGEDVDLPQERDKKTDKPKRVVLYEVWDKRNREVIVVGEGIEEPLEVNADPLGMKNFFPVPKPPMCNVSSSELVPKPDYCFIEELDGEIQELVNRQRAVTKQIKAASLHDASLIEIENFEDIKDGQSIPVEHLSERMEGGPDLRKLIMFWPNEERAQTLQQINQQLQEKRAQVDEILGISDIVRGVSNPMDGQDTNKLKERWAGIRLHRKQGAIQRMVRDLFRMMAEVTVEHVTAENLTAMTQVEVTPEIMALLKNDVTREFAVNVETDSTIAKDEYAERSERTDLLAALNQYVSVVAPAVAANTITADLAKEMLQIAVDPYRKYSKSFDDVIEKLPDQQAQLANANQQIAQSQQQVADLQAQLDQANYALAQFSQSEEGRKNTETQGKFAKDMATAQSTMSGMTDEQAQAGKTWAETLKTGAETEKIYHEMSQPMVVQNAEPV
jgi:hypothetical protein